MNVRALITGISGQDGGLMALRLIQSGAHVLGLSRNPSAAWQQLPSLVSENLHIEQLNVATTGAIAAQIEDFQPDLIFNFAAHATGSGMFDAPQEMSRLNGTFVLDILEAIRNSPRREKMRFVQASSSEMFGHVDTPKQDETTPLRPKSPYGAAKAYAHHMIGIYRNTWGIHASSAILYNHESIRRSHHFVTRKIAQSAVRIKLGLQTHLELGTLDATRDWGHAEEYVEAMHLIALAPKADDYVVATGQAQSLRHVCEVAFAELGLDWQEYVRVDKRVARAVQSAGLLGDPSKIKRKLGWQARRGIDQIMPELVAHEMELHLKRTE